MVAGGVTTAARCVMVIEDPATVSVLVRSAPVLTATVNVAVPLPVPLPVAKVTKAIKKLAPRSVDVTVTHIHSGETWLADTKHVALQAAARAVEKAFGKAPVFTREGGSIPVVATFDRVLKVPSVLMGIGLHDDNLHAPNEKLDLDNFYNGNEAAVHLMAELAQPTHR